MKVRTVELAGGKKVGVVWCMGCGAYHGFVLREVERGREEPSTLEALTFRAGTTRCARSRSATR